MPRQRPARHHGPPLGESAGMPRRGHGWRTGPMAVERVRSATGVGNSGPGSRCLRGWDTVLAMLSVVIAEGATIRDGCRWAVRMAAEQVCRMGVEPAN